MPDTLPPAPRRRRPNMPKEDAELLRLREEAGASFPRIAALLGRPLTGVSSRYLSLKALQQSGAAAYNPNRGRR